MVPAVAHRGRAGEFGNGPDGCKTLGNSHLPKELEAEVSMVVVVLRHLPQTRYQWCESKKRMKEREIFMMNMRTHFSSS